MQEERTEQIRQKFWEIWDQTQSDPEYARLFAEMADLEPLYEAVVAGLSYEDQDIIRDYVNQCEAMSQRMLECACERILFKD